MAVPAAPAPARRLPRWALWLLLGPAAGGPTFLVVGPAIFLGLLVVDGERLDGSNVPYALVAAIVGALVGTFGGFAVGALGAVAVAVLDRAAPARPSAVDAVLGAVLSGALAAVGLVGVLQIELGGPAGVAVLALPIAVATAFGAALAAWAHRRGRPSGSAA